MKNPIRMPDMMEQHLLDGVKVRLISDAERLRYNQYLDKQHYLKCGTLVGEQLRYMAESFVDPICFAGQPTSQAAGNN